MSVAVESNIEATNPPLNSSQYEEPQILSEGTIEAVTEAIKNSENIEQFYEHVNSASKPKRITREREQEEVNTEAGSPVKRHAMSVTRSPQRAYLSRLWDPMAHVNSSDEEECTFVPQINKNAGRLALRTVNGSGGDTNEALYRDSFARKQKQEEYVKAALSNREKVATTVKIQPKSMKLVLKRLQCAMKNLVKNAEESETQGRLTFEGIGTVFYRLGLFQNLEFIPKGDQGEKSSMSINHAKVKPERLSKEILFHENFWKICKLASQDENSIDSELVEKFIIILVEERSTIPESSSFMQEIMDNALDNIGHKSEEGESAFNKLREEKNLWTMDKVVIEFRRIFDDKTKFMESYHPVSIFKLGDIQFDNTESNRRFAPEINKKSQKLDSKFFAKNITKAIGSETDLDNPEWKNRNQRLYKYAKFLNDKKALYLEARIGEELAPCTFTPKVVPYKKSSARIGSASPSRHSYFTSAIEENPKNRHLGLYEVARLYKEKLQQKAYAYKKKAEIEEMADCTFQPNLNRNYECSQQRGENFYAGVPRGFKKIVERLHLGEHLRVSRKEELERIPRGENYERNRDAPFNSPTFLSRDKIRRKEVLVNVDVSIGPGRTGRIGIHRGDNAKTLAKNFARTYSLNENMRESLETLLQSYISSYFSQPTSYIQGQNVVYEQYEQQYEQYEEEEAEHEEEEEEEDEEEEREEYENN